MNEKINALKGGNLDIDLVSHGKVDWKQSDCPWNKADGGLEHQCAVKGTSICKYFCGVKYLDSVLCSYPYESADALPQDEKDRASTSVDVSKGKILLTSAGFDSKTIGEVFLRLVGKEPKEIKALFIPTAAINPPAIAVLPKCMDDLLDLGIPPENIRVFDLHCSMTREEISAFDAIYVTGGDPQYLLNRINETGFNMPLNEFVSDGGVYVGVSAGSIVAAGNLPYSLGYLKALMRVHMETGTVAGVFDNTAVSQIDLANDMAVLIYNDKYEIIE